MVMIIADPFALKVSGFKDMLCIDGRICRRLAIFN